MLRSPSNQSLLKTMLSLVVMGVWVVLLITRSAIFYPIRQALSKWPMLAYLSECALCTGAWVGAVEWVLFYRELRASVVVAVISLCSCFVVLVYDVFSEVLRWLAHVGDQKPQDPGK